LKEGEYDLPMFFPSLKKVKDLEKHLRTLDIQTTSNGCGSTFSQWFQMAFKIPAFVESMDLSTGSIDIKFGGDGFRMARSSSHVNLYFTLFNLGKLIHSPVYVFTLASLDGKESRSILKDNLRTILDDLTNLQQNGINIIFEYYYSIFH
jgi:hypothetical protein